MRKITGKDRRKEIALSIVATIGSLLIAYLIYSQFYYHQRICKEHPFDPYLQIPSLVLDRASMDKAQGVFRILCLGGSTTLDFNKPKEKSWPFLLQNSLQKKYPQAKVEIINAGMPWYTTKHSLINYVTYYRDWHPDLVLVMHGINDLYRSFSPEAFAIGPYNDRWAHFYGPAIEGAKRPQTLEQFLYLHFLIYGEKLSGLLSRVGVTIPVANGLPQKETDFPMERYCSLDMFKRHLALLTRYARFDKAEVILMTEPYLCKPVMSQEERRASWFGQAFCVARVSQGGSESYEYASPGSLSSAMELFNKTTKEIAREEGVFLIDAANHIAKDLDHFSDDVHFKEAGSRALAELVAEDIVSRNLIEQKISERWSERLKGDGKIR